MVTAETPETPYFKCFIHMKSQFKDKFWHFPLRNFLSLVLPRNAMLQHHIIQFLLYYLSSGHLQEDKKKEENLKLLALKVLAVAYKRWSLTTGFIVI